MAIQRFDKKNVGEVLDACKEALELVAEDFGLVLQRKGCTFHHNELPVAFKLVAPERTESGEAVGLKETEFRSLAWKYGLSPDDYGKVFSTWKGTYRIVGIKPKARKYPVLAADTVTGKLYVFGDRMVRDKIEREEA